MVAWTGALNAGRARATDPGVRTLLVTLALGCCGARVEPELPAARVQSEPYVTVIGQVQRPGLYRLVAPITLTQIVSAAGLTPIAWKSPLITRTTWDGRRVRARVSLHRIEAGERPDVWLFPGDVVFVDANTF